MPRGRPKLTALQILDGNPSKRLLRASGVEGLGAPMVAEHLSVDARDCVEVIRASMPEGVYCALDSFHLAAFAMAWAVHKRAATEIGMPGFEWIETNDKGNRAPNVWFRILNTQAAIIVSLGDRLGLDPKSRASIAPPGQRDASKFAGLIGSARTASSSSSRS